MNTELQHFYGVCERTGLGAMAEPLNLLTNLFFFVVVYRIWRHHITHDNVGNQPIWDIHLLTILIAFIGGSSMVFHSFPNPYTEMVDTVFIVLFIVVYFGSAMIRVAQCNILQMSVCFFAFAGLTNILIDTFPNALNDSIGYLSSMIALVMIAVYLNSMHRPSSHSFLMAALIGIISLFFRSIDNGICEEFPLGTHFLWHSFNALLIYILMKQLIRNVNRKARLLREANEHFA